jgi:hypothetical protein
MIESGFYSQLRARTPGHALIRTLYQYSSRLSDDQKKRLRTLGRKVPWLVDAVAFLFRRNLKILATIYGSDKWNFHWYAQHYEQCLASIRRKRLNLLEIGIGGYADPKAGGSSLRMWRAYLPHAHVYGIDIYDKTAHNERRITTFAGSQIDTGFLDSVVEKIGRIDLIVDDGSHINAHVIATFRHLFPHLADGGLYIVEDIETSYWPSDGNVTDRNDPQTSMGFFKSLVDGLNHEEFHHVYEPTYFDLNIKSIFFYHNLVIINKSKNQR